jgi:hypothetical protein
LPLSRLPTCSRFSTCHPALICTTAVPARSRSSSRP